VGDQLWGAARQEVRGWGAGAHGQHGPAVRKALKRSGGGGIECFGESSRRPEAGRRFSAAIKASDPSSPPRASKLAAGGRFGVCPRSPNDHSVPHTGFGLKLDSL